MEKKESPFYTMIRGMATDDNKEFSHDYSGVFYRVDVDYPITLVGLGFYGPPKQDSTYIVDWEISNYANIKQDCFGFLKRISESPVLGNGRAEAKAKANSIFKIGLSPNIQIPANTFIEIAFSLEGPVTRRMKNPLTSVMVNTPNRTVNFELTRGTRQLPELYFIVEDDCPKGYYCTKPGKDS